MKQYEGFYIDTKNGVVQKIQEHDAEVVSEMISEMMNYMNGIKSKSDEED